MNIHAIPVGTRVRLSTGKPCPKRGRWIMESWQVENGEGHIEEIGPDYICVAIERRADGSPIVGYRRTQVIHCTDHRFEVIAL